MSLIFTKHYLEILQNMSKPHENKLNRPGHKSNPRERIELDTAHANINLSGRAKIERDRPRSSVLSLKQQICYCAVNHDNRISLLTYY